MTNIYESLQTLNNFTNTLLGVKQKGGELTQFGKERLARLQQEKDSSEQGTGIMTGPDSEGAKILDTISGVAKTAVSAIDNVIPADLTEGMADKSWSEVAPNIINNIEGPAEMVNDALNDPEVKAALRNALELYAEALGKAIDIAEPELNQITEKFMEVLDDASEKGARGVATALIDTGLALVEAVPGGQIIGIMAAMGYWFNAVVVSTVIPAIKTNAVFLSDGLKMVQNAKQQVVDQYGPRLMEAQQQLTDAVQNVKGKANEVAAQAKGAQKVAAAAANPNITNTAAVLRDPNARKIAYTASKTAASQSSDNSTPFKGMEYSSRTRGGGYSAYGGSKKKQKNAAKTMRRLKRTLNRFQVPKKRGTRKARKNKTTQKK